MADEFEDFERRGNGRHGGPAMRRRWCGKGGFLALLGGFVVAGAGDARAAQPAGAMAEVIGELDKGFAVGPVGAAPSSPWWEEFQVEALTEWINAALSDNHSLQAAERARARTAGFPPGRERAAPLGAGP